MTRVTSFKRSLLGASSACLLWMLYAAVAGAASLSDAQLVTALRAHLEQLSAQDAFSGSVLVAKNGKVLFEHAYGLADHAFNAPNKVDTKFNLGSMGKMFTAVAILQLAEQGKLSLNDTLLKLAPDYPDKDIAGKITVYQLLTHTSGLGEMFNEKFFDTPKDRFTTIEAHLPLFTGKPLLFEPGAKWSYSNAGFIVLGLVIERVSGQSYYDYVREHIFKPSGMLNTDNFKPHDDVPNLAVGYTAAPGQSRRAINFPGALSSGPRITNSDFLQPGASAGGGYSTVEDLFRFAQALQGHKLLSKELTDQDMTGQVPTGRGTAKYAFGMAEDFINGVRVVGHGGGGPGINSNLDMYPDTGYVVAVMSNYDGAADLLKDRIRLWLTGQSVPQPIRLSADALRVFAGKYVLQAPSSGTPGMPGAQAAAAVPSEVPVEITADDQGLWLTTGARHRLLPLSAREFFDDNAPFLRFTFLADEQGRIEGFSFPGPGGVPVKGTRER